MTQRLRICEGALASILFLVQPAAAWNYVTHRVIAAIAYDRLTPVARARVDALLKLHPDYSAMFLKDAPADEPARSRAAFIGAAIWADQIRSDPRFYNDTFDGQAVHEVHATPTLAGFPDMKRHSGWHFTDLPFSQDGTPLEPGAVSNLVTELERLMAETGQPDSASRQVYDLPWLIHLVGDVHAPLHCVSRFSAGQPKGDQGGNLVFVVPGITLHKFWDDAIGTDISTAFVEQTARGLALANTGDAADLQKVLVPEAWAQESLNVAKKDIYIFGRENGSQEHPISLPAGYAVNARKVAEVQALNAGLRLAAVLNQRFH